jgi:hypothetical protein
MCIACEMEFWLAIDEPPPGARVLQDEASRFACDAPASETPPGAAQPIPDERKP